MGRLGTKKGDCCIERGESMRGIRKRGREEIVIGDQGMVGTHQETPELEGDHQCVTAEALKGFVADLLWTRRCCGRAIVEPEMVYSGPERRNWTVEILWSGWTAR